MLYRRVKNTLQIKHSQKRSPQIGIEWCAHKNFLSEELIRLSRLVTTSFTGRTQTSQDERGPSTQPSVRIKRAGRRGAVHRAFCWRENGSINSARKIGSLLLPPVQFNHPIAKSDFRDGVGSRHGFSLSLLSKIVAGSLMVVAPEFLASISSPSILTIVRLLKGNVVRPSSSSFSLARIWRMGCPKWGSCCRNLTR